MGVELPLHVVVTILECCVTFSGVKLSIRSFILFAVSYCFEPKIIRWILPSLQNPQFKFDIQMSRNDDGINALNAWARKESR